MKLARKSVEKPWGRTELPPPFDSGGQRIGEIWFDDAGAHLPLMVKYIFTSEKLSIQVHPSDEQAAASGEGSGKEECWLILDAEADARLGIGTIRPLSPDELREAALSGEIEQLMDWKPVSRGDFFYIPAGTVHAIGAGISLIEVQQNADITYRLYDYGRPRELHLEASMRVSRPSPYDDSLAEKVDFGVDKVLVDGPKFRLELCGSMIPSLDGVGPHFLVPIAGRLGDGNETVAPGECLIVDDVSAIQASADSRLLVARASKAHQGGEAVA